MMKIETVGDVLSVPWTRRELSTLAAALTMKAERVPDRRDELIKKADLLRDALVILDSTGGDHHA